MTKNLVSIRALQKTYMPWSIEKVIAEIKNRDLILFNSTAGWNSPATPAEIHDFENKLDLNLPEDFKTLLQISNGANPKAFLNLEINTLSDIEKSWRKWFNFLKSESEQSLSGFNECASSNPVGHARCLYANNKWIPITGANTAEHLCIDLDPDKEGVVGQVIRMGRDTDEKKVIATSLHDLMALILACLNLEYFYVTQSGDAVPFDEDVCFDDALPSIHEIS